MVPKKEYLHSNSSIRIHIDAKCHVWSVNSRQSNSKRLQFALLYFWWLQPVVGSFENILPNRWFCPFQFCSRLLAIFVLPLDCFQSRCWRLRRSFESCRGIHFHQYPFWSCELSNFEFPEHVFSDDKQFAKNTSLRPWHEEMLFYSSSRFELWTYYCTALFLNSLLVCWSLSHMRLGTGDREKIADQCSILQRRLPALEIPFPIFNLKHFHGGAVGTDDFHDVDKEWHICFVKDRNLFVFILLLCLPIPKVVPCELGLNDIRLYIMTKKRACMNTRMHAWKHELNHSYHLSEAG